MIQAAQPRGEDLQNCIIFSTQTMENMKQYLIMHAGRYLSI